MPTNPRNLRSVRNIQRRDILLSAARVPNSGRLLVASSQNKVFEIDASQDNAQPIEHADHGRYVTAVRLAGDTVISGGYDGRLIFWDLQNRREIRTIDAHTRQVRHLAVSPDGSKLASVGDDMVCRLWNIADGRMLHELRGHEERTPQHFVSMLYVCAFSSDGRHLATGDRVGHVVIWDVAAARQITAVEAPELYTWDGRQRIRSIGGVRSLAFSADGTQLAVGGVGQIGNVDALQGPSRVEVFDWNRGERLYFFTGPNGIVNKLVWHPQNEWLCGLGGGGNGLALFYHPTDRAMIHQGNLPMHTHDAAFSEDFTTLYAVGHERIAVQELRV
jgi:WD40 repeat protein